MHEEEMSGELERIMAALCYLLGPPGSLAFYLLRSKDRFVRFHAIQAVIFWLGGALLVMVLILGIITVPLIPVVLIIFLAAWAYIMYHAEHGEWAKLPLIGDFAEENA